MDIRNYGYKELFPRRGRVPHIRVRLNSAERAEYSVHALPRVVIRDARDSALRTRACAQRGCAQRALLIGCQLRTLRTCPRSQSIITLVTRYHADNA